MMGESGSKGRAAGTAGGTAVSEFIQELPDPDGTSCPPKMGNRLQPSKLVTVAELPTVANPPIRVRLTGR